MSDNLNQSAGNLQRSIQQEQDGRDAAKPDTPETKEAVQTGNRSQPGTPLPSHQWEREWGSVGLGVPVGGRWRRVDARRRAGRLGDLLCLGRIG